MASKAPTLRKIEGSLKGKRRGQRKHEYIRKSVPIELGQKKLKPVRGLGGNVKIRPLRLDEGNMFDPETKKFQKVKILNVVENTANRAFVRQNVLNKGAIVNTDQGLARIVNRPGQDGQISLIKIKK